MEINKISLEKLSKMQKHLDSYIYKVHKIVNHKQETLKKRLLSLIVEICEFANETKCFKYWRKNKDINNDKVTEEYIDCLHFLLSIANDLDIKLSNSTYFKIHNLDLTGLILGLISNLTNSEVNELKSNYFVILNIFWNIGEKIGISEEQIESEYIKKNNININRQKNNY